jgi:hypothetical protein
VLGQLLLRQRNVVGASPPNNSIIDWQQFKQYLLQHMTPKTAGDRYRYSKQYSSVLLESNRSPVNDLLQLSPTTRIEVMKALSNLARFTGTYPAWQGIIRQYQLSWSTGTEKIDAFTRFFDDTKDLDTMVGWLRQALARLPSQYSSFLLFCTLTGLFCFYSPISYLVTCHCIVCQVNGAIAGLKKDGQPATIWLSKEHFERVSDFCEKQPDYY